MQKQEINRYITKYYRAAQQEDISLKTVLERLCANTEGDVIDDYQVIIAIINCYSADKDNFRAITLCIAALFTRDNINCISTLSELESFSLFVAYLAKMTLFNSDNLNKLLDPNNAALL